MTHSSFLIPRSSLRLGLIGFGSIGRNLAEAILEGQAGRCELAAVLVRSPHKLDADTRARLGCLVTSDAADFLATGMDLVVEAAGHDAVKAYGEDVLRQGKGLLLISVGALADAALQLRLERAAHDFGGRLLLATGAIAGLDAISSAAIGGLDAVTHSIRKPPRGLLPPDEAAEVERSGQPRELYSGPAREAVIRFPENVNVAAAVSLAGLGLDRTIVRVVADPSVVRNTHEVEARGAFGELRVLLQNIPSDNPKTGRLTAMSMIKALRNLTAPVVVGV
ncbi:MAG TPA: aspartate dehydrogenase [Chloroflexota bacterium]|nr:aspartate dehydrogenase [Chloroflexota bacterium]